MKMGSVTYQKKLKYVLNILIIIQHINTDVDHSVIRFKNNNYFMSVCR